MFRNTVRIAALAAAVFASAMGCGKKAPTGGPAGGGPSGPAGAAAMVMQVVAAEARLQPVSEKLSLVGTLAANEVVEIKSEVGGVVQEILFDEGQAVNKGDLIMRLDETKFAAAVSQAEANSKLSRAGYERAQQLFQEKLISQQEFDQAAATYQGNEATLSLRRRELRDARILAPFSGMTGARAVSPGQVIGMNTSLTWLVDLRSMKVEIPVPERFIGQLRIGQPVDLSVAAYPGRKFSGEIYFIAPQLDAATRTVLIKARIPNVDGALKGGMFASLDLTLQIKEQAVVVPEAAIMANGERTTVYAIGADDTVQIRPVRLGIRLPGLVEVVNGVAPGEKVIVEGVQKVRPGGKVKYSLAAWPPAGEQGEGRASGSPPATGPAPGGSRDEIAATNKLSSP